MASHIRRRKFLATLGGAAAAWPLAARAQQPDRVRRLGVFMPGVADDPEYQARNAAFLQGLGELGWIVGRNVRIDYRWGAGDVDRYRMIAAELVALAPDAILALGYATVSALEKATRSVPIVSRMSSIRSAAAWLRAWRGPAATPPDFPRQNSDLLRSGWSCSKRLRRG
jgi:ABC-type uncharacterized transport system substrate-binding protein